MRWFETICLGDGLGRVCCFVTICAAFRASCMFGGLSEVIVFMYHSVLHLELAVCLVLSGGGFP
jgi:hypothetical protein